MRILYLTNFYPPHHIGGYEELAADVGEGLQKFGHSLAILTGNHSVGTNGKVEGNVYRQLYPEKDMRPLWGTIGFFAGRKKRLEADLDRFQKLVTELKPDVIMVWGMWNLPRKLLVMAESWSRPKVVYYIADGWPSLPDAYTLHWKEPSGRWYARIPKQVMGRFVMGVLAREKKNLPLKFEHTLCVSQAVKNQLLDAGLPFNNARVIHNGIDLDPFLSIFKQRQVKPPAEHLSLLYAGRLSYDKGVHTAIEAVARISDKNPKSTLTIIGGGLSRQYPECLHELCEKLGVTDRVIFRSRVPRDQVPFLLAEFDVLLCPSIWPEPLPRIVQEAMAAGLIVMGTEVGGMPEILVNNENGLTFAAEDSEGLARQIDRLAGDPSLHCRLMSAGLQTVCEKFNIQRTIAEIETYLYSVVDSNDRAVRTGPQKFSLFR